MGKELTLLILNPGSTSTKVAVYANENAVCSETLRHSANELARFSNVWQQFPCRLELCKRWAQAHGSKYSAVVAIGGLLRPLDGGVYYVNQRMLDDARMNLQGEHASNLGCALANELARQYHCNAFVVDPVSVDEFEPLACYSGHPLMKRRSLSHALNIHTVARRAAEELSIQLSRSRFIVAHLGGGISIAAVLNGKIIDVNDAASDGPFSPERTGGLPLQPFISLCFSGKSSEADIRAMVMGKGGLVAYLGTNSAAEIEQRINVGDKVALEVYQAMAYQIAKEIGAMTCVLKGDVHAIILTGGLAQSSMLMTWIKERVQFIAWVIVYPGGDEMEALAQAVHRALRGEEKVKEY
ncbi:MAG: butyrate kinase [Ignavibacteriae bacterium]|nr:butyrate kinase [Ignavibacteriota bacterium]